MVSGPHALKMALGELFSIFRENSPEIFKMLVPKSYCTEYAVIDPTCQISEFQLFKIDWAKELSFYHKLNFLIPLSLRSNGVTL